MDTTSQKAPNSTKTISTNRRADERSDEEKTLEKISWENEFRDKMRTEEAARRRLATIKSLGGIEPFEEYTFENYRADLNNTHRSFKICREFNPTSGNLFIVGPPGTGKTHLATAITRRVLDEGGQGRVFTKSEFVSFIRGRKAIQTETDIQDMLEELTRYKILVIDDIETDPNSTRVLTFLKDLLDKRKKNRQAGMVLTSNKPLEVLNEILGLKIVDRIDGMFQILVIQADTPSARGILKRERKINA